MPCYRPIHAYQSEDRTVTFVESAQTVRTLTLACLKCVGCRLKYSSDWACRILHEAQLHEENSYITLTYADPLEDYSLHYPDFQGFMRELRWHYYPIKKVRFYVAGEYGENFGRPHWHAIIFGHRFGGLKPWEKSPSGHQLYRSKELERFWKFGYSSVGNVTWESAAYCARYVMKKMTGRSVEGWYDFVDVTKGVMQSRVPEFCRMSLKPGIGAGWVSKFESDVYPEGKVVVNGRKQNPPRYYDKRFVEEGGDDGQFSLSRHLAAVAQFGDSSPERLAVKEIVAEAKLKFLKRDLGKDGLGG